MCTLTEQARLFKQAEEVTINPPKMTVEVPKAAIRAIGSEGATKRGLKRYLKMKLYRKAKELTSGSSTEGAGRQPKSPNT